MSVLRGRLDSALSEQSVHSFVLSSQTFLQDMMQFFADRCGGMAVMILAGAGEVSLYVYVF